MDPSATLSSSLRAGGNLPLKESVAQHRGVGDSPPPYVPETRGRVRSPDSRRILHTGKNPMSENPVEARGGREESGGCYFVIDQIAKVMAAYGITQGELDAKLREALGSIRYRNLEE